MGLKYVKITSKSSTSALDLYQVQVWINNVNVAKDLQTATASSSFSHSNYSIHAPTNTTQNGIAWHSDQSPNNNPPEYYQLELSQSYDTNDLQCIAIDPRYDDYLYLAKLEIYDENYTLIRKADDLSVIGTNGFSNNHIVFTGPAYNSITSFDTTSPWNYILPPKLLGITFDQIEITQDIDYLHFSEVQVWVNGVNIALNGSASFTRGGEYMDANIAINNVINPGSFSGSSGYDIAHSSDSYNNTWLLTLDQSINTNDMQCIVIYNRLDSMEGAVSRATGWEIKLKGSGSVLHTYDTVTSSDIHFAYKLRGGQPDTNTSTEWDQFDPNKIIDDSTVNQSAYASYFSSPGVKIYDKPDGLTKYINLFPIVCFLEGTKIACLNDNDEECEIPIQKLKIGQFVKTVSNGYVPIKCIGNRNIANPKHKERIKDRLYYLSRSKYPSLNEDLFITGCHSILVEKLTLKQKEETINELDRIFVTDNHYRLMAYIDEKAIPYSNEKSFTVWHLCLEHEDTDMNYGIYANGLLVESCSERNMKLSTYAK